MLEINHPPAEMDPLVSSQQRLFALIKRSHRLFLTLMIVSLLILPAVVIFISLIEYYIPRDFPITVLFSDSLLLAPIAFITIVLLVLMLKKSITFIFTSHGILQQIESDSETSQLLVGLTTYITHLLSFVEPFHFRIEKQPSPSLSETLERFERQLKRQKFQEIALVAFFVILLANYLRTIAVVHPNVIRQPLIYVALMGVFLLLTLRARMLIKWKQVTNKWIQGFHALNTWGENLEQLFHQQQGAEGDKQ